MIYALIALQVVTVAALAVVAFRLVKLREAVRESEAKLTLDVPPTADLKKTFEAGSGQLITIEVLNPLELAATKAKFAGAVAGALLPGVIRGVVNQQAVKIISDQLPAEGVKAEVRVQDV